MRAEVRSQESRAKSPEPGAASAYLSESWLHPDSRPTKPDRVVVVSWGNPLRGDDGAGQLVAEAIEKRWSPQEDEGNSGHPDIVIPSGREESRNVLGSTPIVFGGAARDNVRVSVLTGQQPLPEWAPILAEANVVFLIDATTEPDLASARVTHLAPFLPPGEKGSGIEREPRAEARTIAHAFGPRDLLALAASLYGGSPETFLVEIPAHCFEFGETLSPATAQAVGEAVRWIDEHLRELSEQRAFPPLSPALSPTRGEREAEPELRCGGRACTKSG